MVQQAPHKYVARRGHRAAVVVSNETWTTFAQRATTSNEFTISYAIEKKKRTNILKMVIEC